MRPHLAAQDPTPEPVPWPIVPPAFLVAVGDGEAPRSDRGPATKQAPPPSPPRPHRPLATRHTRGHTHIHRALEVGPRVRGGATTEGGTLSTGADGCCPRRTNRKVQVPRGAAGVAVASGGPDEAGAPSPIPRSASAAAAATAAATQEASCASAACSWLADVRTVPDHNLCLSTYHLMITHHDDVTRILICNVCHRNATAVSIMIESPPKAIFLPGLFYGWRWWEVGRWMGEEWPSIHQAAGAATGNGGGGGGGAGGAGAAGGGGGDGASAAHGSRPNAYHRQPSVRRPSP